jgi:hypothetical protein
MGKIIRLKLRNSGCERNRDLALLARLSKRYLTMLMVRVIDR